MTENIESGETGATAEQTEISSPPFTMTDLPEKVQASARRLNWTELMPVQVQTIPHMLDGHDVMVQSQTGSGKTGAFLLPILNILDPDLAAPQALILAPTRELAVQVSRDAEELGREMGIRSLPIYGGVGYKPQIQGLEAGAQLIIGTPGRILDHLLKGTLNLDELKVLVFDEADRMLSMGFYPDMKQLQRYLPQGLQSTMFSATYPPHVMRLAQQFLIEPVFVSLSQAQVAASDVLHVVYKVPAMQKSRILVKIIEQENPASGIIFCNTKADVHFVSTVLRRFGYDVGEISADLSQNAREEVLEKLRLNRLKFLVATDVAARGIDIHELSHVFQYQPPQDHEAYVHRTGRTGRAGAAGVAISLVSGMEEIELEQIAKKFAIAMEERQVPADEDLETLISQRAVFLLEARLRDADNIRKERMQRFMRVIEDLAANEDSRALLALLIDDFYQQTFHAPLEQPSEKLLDMVRPVAPAVAVRSEKFREEGERAENEKRRRRRPRKKSGVKTRETGEIPLAPVQADAPVVAEPAAADVVAEAPGQQSDAAADSVAYGDAGEEGGESGTPKKRRRRRPRKPAGSRPEGSRESDGSAGAGMEAAVPEIAPAADTAFSPAGDDVREDEENGRAPRNSRSRSRGRRKPAQPQGEAQPRPPRKKIFLE